MALDLPGDLLGGRYRLEQRIGEGATAEVYRAIDVVLDRPVAVKLLRPSLAANEISRRRFLDEARAAARLTHPNVVAVFDVGIDGDRQYLVMELVAGPSLKDLIRSEGPLPVDRALTIAVQVLDALHDAHARGIVHRDVKPQNVLLTVDSTHTTGSGHAKVADFGIAAAANTPQPGETGIVVGTAHYISPEQALGQPASVASDLYAVGVVLYEMLTGQLPFTGDSPLGIALQHVQAEPPSPRQYNPRLTPRIEASLRRALTKRPNERYPNASAFARELRGCLQAGFEQTSAMPTLTSGDAASPRRPVAVSPRRRSGGLDWFAVVVGVLVFLAIVGLVPLTIRIIGLYERRALPGQPALAAPPTPLAAAPPLSPTPQLNETVSSPPTPTAAPRVAVPELVGRRLAEAESQLRQLGLTAQVVEETVTVSVEPDTVVAQRSPPGTLVAPGAVVEVVVARGLPGVPAPPVVWLPRDDAERLIRQSGLTPVAVTEHSGVLPAGRILAQQPAPGEPIEPGGVMTITVSLGPRPPAPTPTPRPVPTPTLAPSTVVIPNVVGQHENEARQALEAAGLRVRSVNYQSADQVPDREYYNRIGVGHVLSQQPSPGTIVPKGDGVDIAVRRN
ncbi:MAG: PASTA domain-containing protein [Chloroflexi bacterium]|nr:PASTA domain-containing protein [Chloroflexota bacterium]